MSTNTIQAIQSHFQEVQVSDFQSLEAWLQGAAYLAVAYTDPGVIVGHYTASGIEHAAGVLDSLKYVQVLRVFNEHEELLLKRTSTGWSGRLRNDQKGEAVDVYDAEQVLVGTTAHEVNAQYTKISEDRGAALVLPLSKIHVDTRKKRAYVLTRNYIGYLETEQASYVDARFVKFDVKGA